MDVPHPGVDGESHAVPVPPRWHTAEESRSRCTHGQAFSPHPREGPVARAAPQPRGWQGQRAAPQGTGRAAGSAALGRGRAMERTGTGARGDSAPGHAAGRRGLACYGTARAGHPCQDAPGRAVPAAPGCAVRCFSPLLKSAAATALSVLEFCIVLISALITVSVSVKVPPPRGLSSN